MKELETETQEEVFTCWWCRIQIDPDKGELFITDDGSELCADDYADYEEGMR